jgi:hypothetical protein
MHDWVALSVTVAELVAVTPCYQDILSVIRIMESIELKVKKHMILKLTTKVQRNWHTFRVLMKEPTVKMQ